MYNDVKKTGEEAGNAPDDTDKQGAYNTARNALAKALDTYMKLYVGTPDGQHQEAVVRDQDNETTIGNDWVVDWRNAIVETLDDGSGRIQVRLPQVRFADGTADLASSALNLASGASYYFHLARIFDLATPPNELDPSPCDLTFTTRFAKVSLSPGDELTMDGVTDPTKPNDPGRIDYHFIADPQDVANTNDEGMRWDMLIWADTSMNVTLYSRDPGGTWTEMCTLDIPVDQNQGFTYRSVNKWLTGTANPTPDFGKLQDMTKKEYAIHVNKLEGVQTLLRQQGPGYQQQTHHQRRRCGC